jgi:hypothetical protein
MKKTLNIFFTIALLALHLAASSQVKMKKITRLNTLLTETSGLVFYQNKYLITHNDGGNRSELFVLDLNGEIIKRINVLDTKNRDWEDLTTDDKGNLYIGDFGNNDNERKECQIYIIPKGFIEKEEVKPKKIDFTYEDQKDFPPKKKQLNYDCEAFFWKDSKLYLFTKCRTEPYTGITKIYQLNPKKGDQEAKLIGSIMLCKSGWRFCSVTSIDYFPSTNTLAILTYSKLYLISDFYDTEFWNGNIRSYSLPIVKQREAITFKNKNSFYLTDEYKTGLGGGNLYNLELK